MNSIVEKILKFIKNIFSDSLSYNDPEMEHAEDLAKKWLKQIGYDGEIGVRDRVDFGTSQGSTSYLILFDSPGVSIEIFPPNHSNLPPKIREKTKLSKEYCLQVKTTSWARNDIKDMVIASGLKMISEPQELFEFLILDSEIYGKCE